MEPYQLFGTHTHTHTHTHYKYLPRPHSLEPPLQEGQTSLQGVHHDAGTLQQGRVVAALQAGGGWRGAGDGAAVLAVGDGVGDGQQEEAVLVGRAGKRLV